MLISPKTFAASTLNFQKIFSNRYAFAKYICKSKNKIQFFFKFTSGNNPLSKMLIASREVQPTYFNYIFQLFLRFNLIMQAALY